MPSPFPGMDPYLEGAEWQSFHAQFASEFVRQLSPQLLPRYFAHPIRRTVFADPEEIGISSARVPDVSVLQSDADASFSPEPADQSGSLVLTTVMLEPIPQVAVEIRDARDRELVAAVELLSPANKYGQGYTEYVKKRNEFLLSTHLLEIDFLHGGRRVPMREPLPSADYYVFLSRAGRRPRTRVWPIGLRDRLPRVPVPLRPGDAEASLDLQAAFDAVYDSVGYRYTNDYSGPPPVALPEDDLEWIDERLRAAGLRS